MNPLAPLLEHLRDSPAVPSAAKGGQLSAPPDVQALWLAVIAHRRSFASASQPIVAVLPAAVAAEDLARELSVWLGEDEVECFPAWETFPFERVSPTLQSMGERQRILWRLREHPPKVMTVSAGALTQRLVPASLQVTPAAVSVGQILDREALISQLIAGGYKRCPQVEHRGNLAVRGSILDVFEPSAAHPVRLDFWGDQVERLCEFSLTDQRSLAEIPAAEFFPCRELLPTTAVREQASRLLREAPWGRQWWDRIASGEMFDGMESYLPWLSEEELALGDVLSESCLLVCLDPDRLHQRAKDIQMEEAELVATFAQTWKADTEELPALHTSYERALANFSGEMLEVTSFRQPDYSEPSAGLSRGSEPVESQSSPASVKMSMSGRLSNAGEPAELQGVRTLSWDALPQDALAQDAQPWDALAQDAHLRDALPQGAEAASPQANSQTTRQAGRQATSPQASSQIPHQADHHPTSLEQSFGRAGPLPMLKHLLGEGYSVTVAAESEGSADRIAAAQLADFGIHLPRLSEATPAASGVIAAPIARSFILPDAKLAVLTESQITGKASRRVSSARSSPVSSTVSSPRSAAASRSVSRSVSASKAASPAASRKAADALRDSIPFAPDSYVVHRHHGIAKYAGIHTRELQSVLRDYLLLEYRGNDKLFVPVEQLDTLRPYTGGETPKLSRMGGADWQRTTGKVRAAVAEVAEELVELYRTRQVADGFAFPEDSVWQQELESSFLYEETPDQAHAAQHVKGDMESRSPMDRLVCGDVGFGKTEIAVRAAFKAIQAGKQVALLVPTTLLAQQHFDTFTQRFGSFSVSTEMLSRFVPPAEAKTTLKKLASGEVQLVIGTHRLLSKDVRFHDLGLLILDEEQRFGVRHKERIKAMRSNVDVLTLTATPIPRTLEMSLTGIRDLSLIQTPPADRRPIFTYVGTYDERAVAEAVRRELLREGQAFYVHNRVRTIEEKAERLRDMLPEARFVVAHGQMDGATLEEVAADFVARRYDVLVCSTIIESGIDIPSVNTLIVENAHKFGLAQLHQLRGRVGRSHQRAYAYLFTPPDMELSEEAYERLRIVEEHNELGAGSLVAMRDLEIRGAGNLLGVGQSGHIAAVGYDLYCQLVSEKVAELRGEKAEEELVVDLDLLRPTHLPTDYMPHEATRLEAYRNIAAVQTEEAAEDLAASWQDRFGTPPPEAEALLEIARLRAACVTAGIASVKVTRSPRHGSLIAAISPLNLPESRKVRLERLYPGSTYSPSPPTLELKLTSETTAAPEIIGAIRELTG